MQMSFIELKSIESAFVFIDDNNEKSFERKKNKITTFRYVYFVD